MITIVGLQLPIETSDKKTIILRVQAEVQCEGKKYGVYYEFKAVKPEFYSEVDFPMEITLEYCPIILEPVTRHIKCTAKDRARIEPLLESAPEKVLFSLFRNRNFSDKSLIRLITTDFIFDTLGWENR